MPTTTPLKAMKSLFIITQALACLACGIMCQPASAATSSWVFYGSDNRLHYKNDANGNHIMDFSYAGYGGGGVALPILPVMANVSASGGDDTSQIQSAINKVSALAPDANGFRGAVLLAAGNYNISSTITINTSGVVLRGSGSGTSGTVITMTGTTPFQAISVAGSGSLQTVGSSSDITDTYVPSGAMSFHVNSTAGFSVGESVVVQRPVTQAWVDSMGMCCLTTSTGAPETWIAVGTVIRTDRAIAAINGNQITLDAPLTDNFDSSLLTGSLVGYTFPGRISNVGVEHLRVIAPALDAPLGSPQFQGIIMHTVIDGWAQDLVFQDTQNTVVTNSDTKHITFDHIAVTHTVAHTGTMMEDYSLAGTEIFTNESSTDGQGEWSFTTQGDESQLTALLNFSSTQPSGIAPHQRWSTGLLADSCSLPNAPSGTQGIAYSDRGNHGSGQGWDMGWGVAWNIDTPYLLVQQPPGGANWCIGCIGQETSAVESGTNKSVPNGYYDSLGTHVTPSSLYLAQMLDRRGATALANIGYPLNTALPAGWSDNDIGTPSQAGSATYNPGTIGTFMVNGGGTDIYSTSDNFNYVYEAVSGNTTAIARVATQENTSAWAKAGLMFRETRAANSAYVFVMVTPSNGVSLQYRSATGATAATVATVPGPVAPYWLKLVRSNNTFTAYSSIDGVNWTQVGSIAVTMASNANVGFAVTAHNNTALNTSTFDNVTVSTPAPDFTIAASPSSQTIIQGGSTSYTASVSPINGFTGTVNLSVNGLPSGAAGTFNPTSISGGSGSSTLSVTTASTTPTGTFTLTITGTSGSLSHATTVTLVVNPSTGLPPGWTDSDIGTPGLAGSATFASGTFTVNGGGADIWSTSDNFNYAYVSTTGDVTITARVASQQNTNVWAKSGVMIQETTAANAAFVHVFVTPANGVNMQYRPSTGASAVQLAQVAGVAAPYWVQIQRSGSTFTGFVSADGVTWTQVGTISVTMASSALQGLSVTAHDNTVLNTSTFDNVTINTPVPPVTLAPTADAYVQDGTSANTNFGAATTLLVKNSTTGFNRHTFLKFDLSAVSTVSSARLRLFGNLGGTSGTSPVTAHQVSDNSWTETGITWNNQPAIGTGMTTVSVGITAQYWEWDVTSYIQSQKAAGQTSVTLELQNDVSTAQPAAFNSREAASNPPQLVVNP